MAKKLSRCENSRTTCSFANTDFLIWGAQAASLRSPERLFRRAAETSTRGPSRTRVACATREKEITQAGGWDRFPPPKMKQFHFPIATSRRRRSWLRCRCTTKVQRQEIRSYFPGRSRANFLAERYYNLPRRSMSNVAIWFVVARASSFRAGRR